MKSLKKYAVYDSAPDEVFKCIDDLGVTGMHMTTSSVMMMGSKLHLEYLTENHSGPGTRYRWSGKMLGISMDFTVEVTKWIAGKEKVWETIGKPKMIIYSWYQMHLMTASGPNNRTKACLSISYEKPLGFLNRVLSFLFANWYCRWCLRHMLDDTKKILQKAKDNSKLPQSKTYEIRS